LRAHNQFLTIFAAFGIFGLLWFLATLILPPLILKVRRDYYFNFFLVISILSMLNEDTLETQAGVTFFAFFYVIFLFGRDRHCNAFPPPTGQKVTKS
jgi:O-antigen ligase